MILWGLTHDSGVLGFGNVHFFLSILYALLLRSISRKELLPFHFVRSAFLPLLKYPVWWSQWSPLCERAWVTVSILTLLLAGGWSPLLRVEWSQRGCECSYPHSVVSCVAWSKCPPAAQCLTFVILLALVVDLSSGSPQIPSAPVAGDISVSLQSFLST